MRAEGELAGVVQRNIAALLEMRRKYARRRTAAERIIDAVTAFLGSKWALLAHAVFFAAWFVINTGLLPFVRPFDPPPFVMMAMVASVEAIFLSTFVLITQNRSQVLYERREDLDLQIDLLAEHEITRLIQLVDAIADHLGVEKPAGAELGELERDVEPEQVLEQIESADAKTPE